MIPFENPVFVGEHTSNGGVANGKMIEMKEIDTKSPDVESRDDEEDNAGFEKLEEKGNKVGLMVYNFREGLIEFIKRQKVRIFAALRHHLASFL